MNWVCLADFPVGQDLSLLNRGLKQANIICRITEEHNQQRLWVGEPFVNEAAVLVADFERTGAVAPPSEADAKNTPPPQQGLMGLLLQAPVTLVFIILGVLGHLVVSLPLLSLYENATFLPIKIEGEWIATYAWRWQEPWRLLTPIFLHFGVAHIVFNAVAMLQIGSVIERRWGVSVYLVLCLLSGVAGNLAQGAVTETPLFGGLSGIVYGLFAFNGWLQWRQPRYAFPLAKGFYIFLGVFLILGFTPLFSQLFGVNMANAAHLGGLLGGLILAECLLRLGISPNDGPAQASTAHLGKAQADSTKTDNTKTDNTKTGNTTPDNQKAERSHDEK